MLTLAVQQAALEAVLRCLTEYHRRAIRTRLFALHLRELRLQDMEPRLHDMKGILQRAAAPEDLRCHLTRVTRLKPAYGQRRVMDQTDCLLTNAHHAHHTQCDQCSAQATASACKRRH